MRASVLLLALAAVAGAAPEGWLGTMDEGIKAAAKSGKPVLVVTIWAGGA